MQKTIRATSLALGAFALSALSTGAQAAWTFSNDSSGDGTITVTSSAPAFQIDGSDNGSGYNTSFYTQTFASAVTLTFTWQYASLDPSGTVWDTAGYILDGTEQQLSKDAYPDVGSSGIATVDIAAGQVFGFYVDSFDSTGGAGYIAINQDLVLPSAPPPPPPPAIPEPTTPVLMLAGLAALFAAARRRSAADE